jgi:hypothetical protein
VQLKIVDRCLRGSVIFFLLLETFLNSNGPEIFSTLFLRFCC